MDQVVWRCRALKPATEHADQYADVVTAEVAQQLALARSALRRSPLILGEP
ncbi:MAG TPA: hypothetical protein VGH99_10570 [Pseudonocardia sp.]